MEPRQRVEVAHRRRQLPGLGPRLRCGEGVAIGAGGVLPQPELKKDVRRHVARVARFGSHPGVDACRIETEPGVRRVVVGVQQVMERPRVLRVRPQDRFEDSGHAGLDVAAGERGAVPFVGVRGAREIAPHRSQQRERVEGCRLGIAGVAGVQPRHRIRIRLAACRLVTWTEEDLQRGEVGAFLLRPGLRRARGRRRPEPGEDAASCRHVFVAPQGLVVGHGLAPVRHREPRVRLLGALERRIGLFVLEAVERGDTAKKFLLGCRRAGGRKRDAGCARGLCAESDRRGQDQRQRARASVPTLRAFHFSLFTFHFGEAVRYHPRDQTCTLGRRVVTCTVRLRWFGSVFEA